MTDPAQERELIERLEALRVTLKSGDYDGADLMSAWCAMMDARDALQSRIAEVERLTARVKAAVNWVQPPFLTPEASPDEVRSRINLLLADIDAALSQRGSST